MSISLYGIFEYRYRYRLLKITKNADYRYRLKIQTIDPALLKLLKANESAFVSDVRRPTTCLLLLSCLHPVVCVCKMKFWNFMCLLLLLVCCQLSESLDLSLTLSIPPRKRECYYQAVNVGVEYEAEYQVIKLHSFPIMHLRFPDSACKNTGHIV